MRRWTLALGVGGCMALLSASALAIPRSEIVGRAPAFEEHTWTCTAANLTADCADSSWEPARGLGAQVGLPYCWGGWDDVDQFDQRIADGWGAGSLPDGLFLDCTTGVDCSGYVSQLWQHPHKLGTSTLVDVSTEIATTEMQPGDVFNNAGSHVIMFLGVDTNGDVITTESTNASACLGVCRRSRPWSVFAGYVPRAYFYADLPSHPGSGTVDDLINIDAFPFTDARNTEDAHSDTFDYYSAAPDTDERGPEFIYVFHVSAGGTLTASISDAAGVDIDIHLLSSLSADDCLARDDSEISFEITNPGTYYLTADTYVGSTGTEYTGAYLLEADFTGELEPPAPDAGPEASPEAAPPEPAPEAGPDAPLVEPEPSPDASTSTGPSTSGSYEGEEPDGCSCGVPGENRSMKAGLAVLLSAALLFIRRRRSA